MTAPEIIVLGDVNVDLIGLTKSWPCPGEECLADRVELHCGGVGANCALALRKWGVAPQLIACVGCDALGDTVVARLAANEIDVRHIQLTDQAMTACCTSMSLLMGSARFSAVAARIASCSSSRNDPCCSEALEQRV
jgi:sugar/nucleoside kinase (ribokinase family)